MVVWMAYATAVAVLLGAAARALDPVLRSRRRSTRHLWTAALALSVLLPCVAHLRAGNAPSGVAATSPVAAFPTALIVRGADALPTMATRLDRAESLVLSAWILASLALALALLGGLARLSARARRWPTASLSERPFLLSDDFGPALVGVRVPHVVLPRWALSLRPDHLGLVLLHEEEHLRAGDGRLLLAAALAVVLVPWNPALWWQLRRLRAAVELDCDARVLRRGVPPRAYGALLVQLGSRTPGLPFPVAALSTSRSLLERRLSMIVRGANTGGPVRSVLAATAAALLVGVACEAPAPTALRPVGGGGEHASGGVTPADEQVGATLARATGAGAIVLVDGERQVGGALVDLEQADIARIEVMKGPAATDLFGEDGKDGVIQVFTKAGGVGELPVDSIHADTLRADTIRPSAAAGAADATSVYLDGVRFEGDASRLDPTTIDRVEVVKGAEGRIVRITTKKAASGGGEE